MMITEWDDEEYGKVLKEEGREEGSEKRAISIARKMKTDGESVEKIARLTELSEETIATL
jgi:predicted transposase YdaD